MKLTVGQKLWYYRNRYYSDKLPEPIEVEIVKVGRKWATLNDYYGRIDLETLYVDGGEYSSPGRCYVSKEAHDEEVALRDAWDDFRGNVTCIWQIPKGITIADIEQASRLLKLTGVSP